MKDKELMESRKKDIKLQALNDDINKLYHEKAIQMTNFREIKYEITALKSVIEEKNYEINQLQGDLRSEGKRIKALLEEISKVEGQFQDKSHRLQEQEHQIVLLKLSEERIQQEKDEFEEKTSGEINEAKKIRRMLSEIHNKFNIKTLLGLENLELEFDRNSNEEYNSNFQRKQSFVSFLSKYTKEQRDNSDNSSQDKGYSHYNGDTQSRKTNKQSSKQSEYYKSSPSPGEMKKQSSNNE
mmetsp:Transcript_38378/g.36742  ORF Transcript_38378/g.36742 Transcript_38378/m.36742 type:complete len:240 (-) Transcript_38378:962-1681(-)|eukprot:CAMPEP_0170563722 /NCGR_PEP_ID=MMETSP0211-20121228/68540_1 /TAXON_ID=311385 /ORGANISM="Pseudokeronopsis sp., Strain OXSARD2" /LENGTH=239 /DNA_ID=CAMNT_0010882319 /DNA_START=1053 /DNA_END=1772 /DNA_ORIENTATION=-